MTCYLLHSNDRSRASLPVVKKDVALIHISRSLVIFYPKPDTDCNSVVQDLLFKMTPDHSRLCTIDVKLTDGLAETMLL